MKEINFTNAYTKLAVEEMNKRFCKQFKNFIEMANILLETRDRVKDLYTLPFIESCQ